MIKSRRLRWAGHVDTIEKDRNDLKMLTDKPRRPRRRWEDNIRTDIKEININTMKWVLWTQYTDN